MHNKNRFFILTGLSALFILSLSAYYSIIGIGLLFAGRRLFASLFAGALEFAKVTITSYLTRYWNKINKIFRVFFIGATIVLIGISSTGIYCYMTNAYHITAHKIEIVDSKVGILDVKQNILDQRKLGYRDEIKDINQQILSLQESKKRNDEQLSNLYNATINDTNQSWYNNIWRLRNENETFLNNISLFNNKKDSILIQIKNIDNEIILIIDSTGTIQQSTEYIDVGPLGRLSKILNIDMDTIVKWFVFILILIFDPLGVLLVVSFNKLIMNKDHDEVKFKPIDVSLDENNNFIKKNDIIEKQIEIQKENDVEIQKETPVKIQKETPVKIQKETPVKIKKEEKNNKPNKKKKTDIPSLIN